MRVVRWTSRLLTLPAASGFHLALVGSSGSTVLPATRIAVDYPDPTGDGSVGGHHGNGWRVYGSSCVKERYFSVTSSQNTPLSTSTCSCIYLLLPWSGQQNSFCLAIQSFYAGGRACHQLSFSCRFCRCVSSWRGALVVGWVWHSGTVIYFHCFATL